MGDKISIVKCNSKEKELLARLMRAEALGEGNLGMILVGNVGVNRVLCRCFDFDGIRCITDMVYQHPGGFSGIKSPLFFSNPTANEKRLVEKVINGEFFYPATNSLWFYAPSSGNECLNEWYGQKKSGKYKNHCFYEPLKEKCSEIH